MVALAPTWRLWLARPLAVGATAVAAAGASILPMAVLNTVYSGGRTGAAAEHVFMGAGPMWLRWFVNGTTWTLDNVSPPVFPFASVWNRVVEALTPASLAALGRKPGFASLLCAARLAGLRLRNSQCLQPHCIGLAPLPVG